MVVIKDRLVITHRFDVLVSSFGGVGTTFLMKFLNQNLSVNCPNDRDHLKHALYPPISPSPNLKAIYVFGDPIEAAISLFRRNFMLLRSKSYKDIAKI